MLDLPQKSKHLLLTEGFRPSTNPSKAFWDFYALYLLYFKVEGWMGKYDVGDIVNDMRVRKVRDAFWASAVDQARKIGGVLVKSIKDEIEHITDEYLIDQEDVKKWFRQNVTIGQKFQDYLDAGDGQLFRYLTISDVCRIFEAPFWRGEKSDLYGGISWSHITRSLGKLVESLKSGDGDAIALAVDHVYDLEHNTGSILTKIKSYKGHITKEDLDRRASIRSLQDFKSLVSYEVYTMIHSYLSRPNSGVDSSTPVTSAVAISEAREVLKASVQKKTPVESKIAELLEIT